MTTTAQNRTLFDAVIGEPVALAKAQPHQIALSTGSVVLMGSFAGASGILPPAIGYCIAIGVEWAYLKGLSSDAKAPTRWGAILNWSAFGIVVLWGVLWVASIVGAIQMHATGFAGLLLALAHVVPIAWLSLCSAQTHRASMIAERAAGAKQEAERRALEQAKEAERRAFEQAQEAEDRQLARWKEAYTLKQQLKVAQPQPQPEKRNRNRPCVYNGVAYPSLQEAANANGISRQAMSKRLRNQETQPDPQP